jgi:hypothetical protein
MDTKTRTKRYFVLRVKCPSLLTNPKRTVHICSAFVEFSRHEVSRKPLKWKPRYRRKVKGPSLTSDHNPTYTVVAHEWELRDIICQESLPNGNWHANKTLGSPRYEICGKIRGMEGDIHSKRHLLVEINRPSLLNDRNWSYFICSAAVVEIQIHKTEKRTSWSRPCSTWIWLPK